MEHAIVEIMRYITTIVVAHWGCQHSFLTDLKILKDVVSTLSQNYLVKIFLWLFPEIMNKNLIWKPWEQNKNESTSSFPESNVSYNQ